MHSLLDRFDQTLENPFPYYVRISLRRWAAFELCQLLRVGFVLEWRQPRRIHREQAHRRRSYNTLHFYFHLFSLQTRRKSQMESAGARASVYAPDEEPLPSQQAPRARNNVFPLSTRLSTSDGPRDPANDEADYAQRGAATEQRARLRFERTALQRKLDWVEKLSEGSVSLELLREAAGELDSVTYEDLLQERHSLGQCPYPPCSKSASVDYDPNDSSSFRVKLKSNGTLYQQVSKGLGDAYCGKWCSARSEWYRGLILRGGKGDLLEDVEERRREAARSNVTVEIPLPERQEDEIDIIMLPAPPLPAAGPSMTAMIDSLMIKERPTPTLQPAAPQLSDSLHDFERPSAMTDLSPPPVASSSTSKPFPAPIISSSLRPSKKTSTTKRKPPNRTQSLTPFPSSSSPTSSHRSVSAPRTLPPPPIGADPRAPPPRFHDDLTVVGMVGSNPYPGVIEAEPDENEGQLIDEALAVRAMMERGEL